jgi:hypothetical protein
VIKGRFYSTYGGAKRLQKRFVAQALRAVLPVCKEDKQDAYAGCLFFGTVKPTTERNNDRKARELLRTRGLRSVLELSAETEYDEAMSRLTAWIHLLLLAAGILTGCTTLATTYQRVRATLTEPETDQTIHHYGAWFFTPSKGDPGHQESGGR